MYGASVSLILIILALNSDMMPVEQDLHDLSKKEATEVRI